MSAFLGHFKIPAKRIRRIFLQSPARLSIVGFASLIFVGTVLLMLPSASTNGGLNFVDALFTATSASCVTGLVVVDTGSVLSLFGQVVVLGLIQIGGLGIMTLSTLLILIVGKRLTLVGRIIIQDNFTQNEDRSLLFILRDVVLFTFVIELIGLVVMFFCFLPGRGIFYSLYLSVFHSVSAFCNAGFSLFPNSFIEYQKNWVLNTVTCFLIICGGIGFLVLFELKRRLQSKHRTLSRLSLHSKMVLSTSFVLIILGSLLITGMEWQNTLKSLSFPYRFLAGFFQSVTSRTAGFNTLPIGEMANGTLFVLIILMFIGASPGSCGGGIKTTTLMSLIVLGTSRLLGHHRPQLFHRTLSTDSVGKAISVAMISIVVIITGTTILLITEIGGVSHVVSRGDFLEIFFEVVSAFGTVGLSTGITGGLSVIGKFVITLVMFTGRLGPLLIALAFSRREAPYYYYAEENVMIG
ncbi:MAG: TrkH family potassium uptake protein [Pseudomonadota bacterium]